MDRVRVLRRTWGLEHDEVAMGLHQGHLPGHGLELCGETKTREDENNRVEKRSASRRRLTGV